MKHVVSSWVEKPTTLATSRGDKWEEKRRDGWSVCMMDEKRRRKYYLYIEWRGCVMYRTETCTRYILTTCWRDLSSIEWARSVDQIDRSAEGNVSPSLKVISHVPVAREQWLMVIMMRKNWVNFTDNFISVWYLFREKLLSQLHPSCWLSIKHWCLLNRSKVVTICTLFFVQAISSFVKPLEEWDDEMGRRAYSN